MSWYLFLNLLALLSLLYNLGAMVWLVTTKSHTVEGLSRVFRHFETSRWLLLIASGAVVVASVLKDNGS